MSQSANDLIMGGGAPAAKFPTVGTTIEGQIIDTTVSQQRDFATGDLKFWKSGDPMMQAVITVQTDQRDPEIADDDGQRRLFVSSRAMREAVRDAVKAAGAKLIEPGGTIKIQYTGDGAAEGNLNPPKLYRAKYTPPIGVVSASALEDPF
jgi:hypothetical protein